MTQTEFMTVREAADLTHVSQQTVRRWIREGRLEKFRAGPRRVLVRRAEAETLIHRTPEGSRACPA